LIDFLFSDTVYDINPHSKPITAGYQRIILLICTLTVIQQYFLVVFHFFQYPDVSSNHYFISCSHYADLKKYKDV